MQLFPYTKQTFEMLKKNQRGFKKEIQKFCAVYRVKAAYKADVFGFWQENLRESR